MGWRPRGTLALQDTGQPPGVISLARVCGALLGWTIHSLATPTGEHLANPVSTKNSGRCPFGAASSGGECVVEVTEVVFHLKLLRPQRYHLLLARRSQLSPTRSPNPNQSLVRRLSQSPARIPNPPTFLVRRPLQSPARIPYPPTILSQDHNGH